MQNKNEHIFSLLSIFCFILLIRTALILHFREPVGYVTNIYSMFPLSFYAGFVLCYFIASYLMLNGKKAIASLILVLNHLELLLIPFMLGYYSMGRADDMTYIGEYVHIANFGHIAGWDIYPASHIIGAVLSIILGIEANQVSFIVPILFSFLFIIGIYIFSKKLIPHKDIVAYTLLASFILYLGVYNFLNVPNALFYAFMPIYLYVVYSYMRTNSISYAIVFVLMTLVLPYSHPFIVFFVLVLFVYHIVITKSLSNIIPELKFPELKASSFFLLLVTFLTWFFYQGRLIYDFAKLLSNYINRIGRDETAIWTVKKTTQAQFDISDYLQLFICFYGRYIIPALFIFLGFFILYRKKHLLSKKYLNKYRYLISLYIVFLVIQLIFLFNPIVKHQPDRIMNLNFVVYSQIPLFAISLYILFANRFKEKQRSVVICLILTSIWAISFIGVFDSEYIFRPNNALAYNEVEGMKWFSEKKDTYPVNMMFEQAFRYPDLLGFERKEWVYMTDLKDHFGYDTGMLYLSDGYFETHPTYKYGYLVLTSLGELLYQELPAHKRVGRFNKDDFEMFRNDKSANKVYDSLDIDIYFVDNIKH